MGTKAYEYIKHQNQRIAFWLCYNLLCYVCFGIGIYYAYEFMKMQDRVIVVNVDGSTGIGYSAPVATKKLEEDIAIKAAYIFFNRSHNYFKKELAQAVFGKTAYEQLEKYIKEEKDFFEARQIVQFIKIEKIVLTQEYNTAVVRISGKVFRFGNYLGLEYEQVLDVKFGVRLVLTNDMTKLPMRVFKLNYTFEEIYETTGDSNVKN